MWVFLLLGLTVSSVFFVLLEDDNYLNLFLVKVNKRSVIYDLVVEYGFIVRDEVCNIVYDCYWIDKIEFL